MRSRMVESGPRNLHAARTLSSSAMVEVMPSSVASLLRWDPASRRKGAAMRRALLFSILVGCNFNLSSVAAFDIPYDIPAQTVPGNAIANQAGIAVDFSLPPFPINVDVANQAKQNGVGGVISTVKLTSLSLTITQGTCF